MYTKQINIASKFIIGALLIGLGIFTLSTGILTLSAIVIILGLAFILIGLENFLNILINKFLGKEFHITIKTALLNIVIGIVVILTPRMQISLFGIICGMYAIILGIIHGMSYVIYLRNDVRGRYIKLFLCLFFISFGVFLLFAPYLRINEVLNIIAGYFILYGITYVRDGIHELIPNQQKNKMKRKIRITLPVFISAIIPKSVLDEVNKYLSTTEQKEVDAIPEFIQTKTDQVPDIEVFVHVSSKGFGMMGHVDICIDGTIISYGNYDASSTRLFESIGDGVLFIADKEQYIPFVIKDSDKTLFSFGLSLDAEQKEGIYQKLKEIKKNVYEWQPPTYVGKDDEYAARLSHAVETKFFKFHKSKFKTYFVLGTNCVLLADQLIGSAGLDILKMNGIITPGTYYEYLNNALASRSLLVISKEIYK